MNKIAKIIILNKKDERRVMKEWKCSGREREGRRSYMKKATFLQTRVQIWRYFVFWKLKKEKGMTINANINK
jgi:hypothetical protein